MNYSFAMIGKFLLPARSLWLWGWVCCQSLYSRDSNPCEWFFYRGAGTL